MIVVKDSRLAIGRGIAEKIREVKQEERGFA